VRRNLFEITTFPNIYRGTGGVVPPSRLPSLGVAAAP